jgi:hypothetical protein
VSWSEQVDRAPEATHPPPLDPVPNRLVAYSDFPKLPRVDDAVLSPGDPRYLRVYPENVTHRPSSESRVGKPGQYAA